VPSLLVPLSVITDGLYIRERFLRIAALVEGLGRCPPLSWTVLASLSAAAAYRAAGSVLFPQFFANRNKNDSPRLSASPTDLGQLESIRPYSLPASFPLRLCALSGRLPPYDGPRSYIFWRVLCSTRPCRSPIPLPCSCVSPCPLT